MYIHNHYPNAPFPPETQTEWVRTVLELLNAYREAAAQKFLPEAS
jgi:hypothetical protein